MMWDLPFAFFEIFSLSEFVLYEISSLLSSLVTPDKLLATVLKPMKN